MPGGKTVAWDVEPESFGSEVDCIVRLTIEHIKRLDYSAPPILWAAAAVRYTSSMFSGLSSFWLDVLGLFLLIAGFVIGLGAVTVIDLHGFLGRTSSYWTEATTRTHKVTKPMIWIGIALAIVGGLIFYRTQGVSGIPLIHAIVAFVLIINGHFLSFRVSPFLLKREKAGRSGELLPAAWQRKIMASLIISDIGWWGGLFLLVVHLVSR